MGVVVVDTREQKNHVKDYLDARGIRNVRSKLYCGDYALLSDQSLCVDRKKDLGEVCGNLCQQHARFRDEMSRAKAAGIRLVFLVEHGGAIRTLEDVLKWENPRLEVSPYALNGAALYRRMATAAERYGVAWEFCRKQDTGRRICEILGVS